MDRQADESKREVGNKRLFLSLLIGLILIMLCTMIGAASFINYRPQILAIFYTPTPTPRCVEPTLTIHGTSYKIEALKPGAEWPLSLPSQKSGVAYWIEGIGGNFVFALPAIPENIGNIKSYSQGDPIQIQWADCGQENYAITAIDTSSREIATLIQKPPSGFTLLIPSSGSTANLVVQGGRPELLTPEPPTTVEPTSTQADITFQEQTASPDGKSLRLVLSIKNQGKTPIDLNPGDLTLTPPDGTALLPSGIQPALPIEIAPGEEATVTVDFPKPEGNVATFRLKEISMDIYY